MLPGMRSVFLDFLCCCLIAALLVIVVLDIVNVLLQICTECGLLLFSVDQMNYNIIAAAIVLCVKTIYSSIYYNYFPTVFIIIIFITYMNSTT